MKKNIIVMCFGTFDILHPWHEYFLKTSKQFWQYLIVVLARDKNILKIKWKLPYNNEILRLHNLNQIWIADKVVLWSKTDPYKVILDHKPNILCFGYDQYSFNNDNLLNFIKNNQLSIEFNIINSYYPDKYKSSIIKKNLWII